MGLGFEEAPPSEPRGKELHLLLRPSPGRAGGQRKLLPEPQRMWKSLPSAGVTFGEVALTVWSSERSVGWAPVTCGSEPIKEFSLQSRCSLGGPREGHKIGLVQVAKGLTSHECEPVYSGALPYFSILPVSLDFCNKSGFSHLVTHPMTR